MQKLPRNVKALRGTERPDREQKGIEAGARLTEPPVAPDTLSEGARQEWKPLAADLVELGVLTKADLRTLELTAETLATVRALEESIRAEGFVVEMGNGGQKANPCLKALETQRNQAIRLLEAFGLSPRARKYVERAPTARKDNPFARFVKDNEFANLDD